MSAQTSEEQRLIDGLFSRLQEAEGKSGDRDREAETRIQEHVSRQPAAPYYMAQTILIQEAALKQLQARVTELERRAEQSRPSSGGFLAGIFGAGDKRPQDQSTPQQRDHGGSSGTGQPGWGRNSQPGWGARAAAPGYGGSRGGGGFLSGALQTAAGVAGGVMLGNMLMNMFDQHQPEDLANAIDGDADAASAADTSAGALDDSGNYDNADYSDPGMDEPRFEDADYYDGEGSDFDDGGFDEV